MEELGFEVAPRVPLRGNDGGVMWSKHWIVAGREYTASTTSVHVGSPPRSTLYVGITARQQTPPSTNHKKKKRGRRRRASIKRKKSGARVSLPFFFFYFSSVETKEEANKVTALFCFHPSRVASTPVYECAHIHTRPLIDGPWKEGAPTQEG